EASTGWSHPALPSDDEVVAAAPLGGGTEIWMASNTSGTPARLDIGLPQGGLAVWSHDGQQIAFTSAGSLYSLPARGGQRSCCYPSRTSSNRARTGSGSS